MPGDRGQLEFGDDERSIALKRAWERAMLFLSNKVSRLTFESYIRAIRPLSYKEHEVRLGVPSPFAREWLEKRHASAIRGILESILGASLEVRYVVVASDSVPGWMDDAGADAASCPPAPRKRQPSRPHPDDVPSLPLNEDYTFDTFVVGRSNRLAFTAAQAVSERLGSMYNPLFVYGGSGLGKTHLLHAIGHAVRARDPEALISLVDGESFTHHFVTSLREKKAADFRRHYRSVDIWLVDDIQFIASREGTKEEFFHTFNALYQTGRQIVIASDRSPRELRAMDERLRSRFECGLIADIAPPELETREAILRQRCSKEESAVPDDVIRYIAGAIQSNVRTMEGAITRLVAYSSIMRSPISVEMAHDVLGEFFLDVPIPIRGRKGVQSETVVRTVAECFHLTADDLRGPRRDKHIAEARQIAMYLCRELSDMPYGQIGELLGGRDHTTVQRGIGRVESRLLEDGALRATVQELRGRLER